MTILSTLIVALRAVRENRARTALAALGVVIGVALVIVLVAIGQGVRADITHQVQGLGANAIFILPGKVDHSSGMPNPMSLMGISSLTDRDVRSVAALPGVRACVPIMFVFGMVEHDMFPYSGFVVAADSRVQTHTPNGMAEGRFYTAGEARSKACVLGGAIKKDVFGSRPAVGEKITVRDIEFTVVGVLREDTEPLFGQGTFERIVFVPYETARQAFPGGQINRILVDVDYRHTPDSIRGDIRQVLRANHGGREDFGLLTQKQLLDVFHKVFNTIEALLVGLGAISLVVAGLGIMNIMLLAVNERTREIGIRQAVGARRRDLFFQFLVESLVLSSLGGGAGMLLGWGVCRLIGRFSPLHPVITPGVLALAFGVCFLVGVTFGTVPALRAARRKPVDALRWE